MELESLMWSFLHRWPSRWVPFTLCLFWFGYKLTSKYMASNDEAFRDSHATVKIIARFYFSLIKYIWIATGYRNEWTVRSQQHNTTLSQWSEVTVVSESKIAKTIDVVFLRLLHTICLALWPGNRYMVPEQILMLSLPCDNIKTPWNHHKTYPFPNQSTQLPRRGQWESRVYATKQTYVPPILWRWGTITC